MTVGELLAHPLTYVGLAVLLGVGKLAIERLVARGIDRRFDERLEEHRHSLRLAAEQARFEYQRDLTNYNLYVTRRHAAAESVFAKARIAHGAVAGLFGMAEVPTFEEYNRKDMDQYLASRKVPEGMREKLLATWDEDKPGAIAEIQPYLRLLNVHEADLKLTEARNEAYLNELYLDDATNAHLNHLFEALWDWVYCAKELHGGVEREYTRQQLSNAVEAVKSALKEELTAEHWHSSGAALVDQPDAATPAAT